MKTNQEKSVTISQSEHAALIAVAEAIKNCDTQLIKLLTDAGCDGNAIEIQSALANLAAIRSTNLASS